VRIAHLTYSYRPLRGGADVYVEQLYQALARAGHDQRIYQRPPGDTSPFLRLIPNPLRGLPAEFWTQALFLPLRWLALAHEQVIIAHYPHYLLTGWPFPRILGGHRLIGFSHGVTWDDHPGSQRSRIKRALHIAAVARSDVFVANDSHFLREIGIPIPPRHGHYTQVAKGIWLIPNAVDTSYFCPGPPDPEVAKLHPILVPRNLYLNRGVHLAVQAFAEFAPYHPECFLLIAGEESDPAYTRWVHAMVKLLQVAPRVHFMGPVPHQQMRDLYRSAEMTLIPTLAGEGTSLSALESMACGIATISTNVAGLLDLPTYQAQPDPVALAQAMREVYPKRAEIGWEQRKEVFSSYSLRRWEGTWREVVQSALQSPRRL